MAVMIYTKSQCPACDASKKWLDRRGIAYDTASFEKSTLAQTLAEVHGFTSLPIVVAGGDCWAGFRPDRLDAIQP